MSDETKMICLQMDYERVVYRKNVSAEKERETDRLTDRLTLWLARNSGLASAAAVPWSTVRDPANLPRLNFQPASLARSALLSLTSQIPRFSEFFSLAIPTTYTSFSAHHRHVPTPKDVCVMSACNFELESLLLIGFDPEFKIGICDYMMKS